MVFLYRSRTRIKPGDKEGVQRGTSSGVLSLLQGSWGLLFNRHRSLQGFMGATPGPQGIVGNLSNTLQASTTRRNVTLSTLKKHFIGASW